MSILNRRRAYLIRKKNREGLTEDERIEFENLQSWSRMVIEKIFPRPSIGDSMSEKDFMGKFADVIQIESQVDDNAKVRFPTLCACAKCHGIKGLYVGWSKSVRDKIAAMPREDQMQLAYEVALVEHGWYLKIWEQNVGNRFIFPRKCSCECDHVWDEVNVGKCLHNWTCKKCGYKMTVDSSD